ncbi:hypothetical protein KAR91_68355, partial [Candidatus Pacearchaeota archaeon]|nr:hypothetical protein [Candidatus Pacearchaeota archaeon]
MQDIRLFIIDPQNDFCESWGSLCVPGALEDMCRVARLIERVGKRFRAINVTLDCHHENQIFHPMYWIDSSGKHPDPFTMISADDVRNGVWRTTAPGKQTWALEYVETLEKDGRQVLVIWPYHCLIGTPGNNIV